MDPKYTSEYNQQNKPFVPNAPFLYPLKTLESCQGFLMFSGSRERVRWEQMG